MAVADKVIDHGGVSVSTATKTTLYQPGSGVEATIHNVYCPEGTAWELHAYDGTNEILVGTYSGSLLGHVLHCTNGDYFRVYQATGSTVKFGYSGVQTK